MAFRRELKNVFCDLMAMARHPWMLALRPLLRKRGFGSVTLTFTGFAVVAGVVHSMFEGQHPAEGLWWALVTLTTMGHGDVGSVATGGRLTGAALMIVSIGVPASIQPPTSRPTSLRVTTEQSCERTSRRSTGAWIVWRNS